MIPKKYSGDDLRNRVCRPVRKIRNRGGAAISPETLCRIVDVVRGHGFIIETEKCPHCGQSAYIFGVSRDDLELVEAQENGPAYEGTGLMPCVVLQLKKIPEIFNCDTTDPVQLKQLLVRLQGLAEAERDNRLVVLPCKVGDTLYDTTMGDLSELIVQSIPIMIYPDHQYIGFNATNYRGAFILVEMWQIGKTVFLTREEAEAALEAQKGESHETDPV